MPLLDPNPLCARTPLHVTKEATGSQGRGVRAGITAGTWDTPGTWGRVAHCAQLGLSFPV